MTFGRPLAAIEARFLALPISCFQVGVSFFVLGNGLVC
jgi:hypothetical protein